MFCFNIYYVKTIHALFNKVFLSQLPVTFDLMAWDPKLNGAEVDNHFLWFLKLHAQKIWTKNCINLYWTRFIYIYDGSMLKGIQFWAKNHLIGIVYRIGRFVNNTNFSSVPTDK
jgi:hypothetical protein